MGLAYEPHLVTLSDSDVKSPAFLSLNPNNKIPAIIDPNGPTGPLGIFESGAISQWLMFQMGGLGPMFGQMGFFYKFAGKDIEDPRPRERYRDEAIRLLGVLDGALEGNDWIAGDYSIADMAIGPWLNALNFYGTKDAVGFDKHLISRATCHPAHSARSAQPAAAFPQRPMPQHPLP